MGASNPHPHGQIWASERLPSEAASELHRQQLHASRAGCLLCDYLEVELKDGERVVCENDDFVVLVPFWAVWPFETIVLPRRHRGSMPELSGDERDGFADILGRLNRRYDKLFATTFPYSMGFHQQPTDGTDHPEWHLHGHFYPPLLRSAVVRKFMVGYELLAEPQRDITPEEAAQRLRDLR
jgi:UDPglucose--hexose-1-phosphate uridylyltransferase